MGCAVSEVINESKNHIMLRSMARSLSHIIPKDLFLSRDFPD